MAVAMASMVRKLKIAALIKFLFRHWYWIVLILITLPLIIQTVETSIETQNPLHPIFVFGLKILDADKALYEQVELFREDFDGVVGMQKPTNGWIDQVKYGWLFTKNVIWEVFSLLWLISLPFVILYKIIRPRNTSEPAKNTTKAIWIGFLVVLFINMLVAIYYLTQGELFSVDLPKGLGEEKSLWIILLTIIPFHGLVNLILWIMGINF